MKYDINFSFSKWMGKTVEAASEEEAKNIAKTLAREFYNQVISTKVSEMDSPYVKISDSNFKFPTGSIWLVRRYTKWIPAKVISNGYGYNGFDNQFEFLTTGKRVWLSNKGRKVHTRILKSLCEDGKINKPECKTCVARYLCFSNK